MTHRREFVKMAGVFCISAACSPDKLFGTQCAQSAPAFSPDSTAKDVYIVDRFTGPQMGTGTNPFSASTASEFDSILATLKPQPSLAVHLEGAFKTRGAYRWGQYQSRNLGQGWSVSGAAEIALEPTAIDSQPIYCLAGPAQSVTGIATRGNHSTLANGWTGTLRTGGVLIEGDGRIDGVTFRDFGSLGLETFVAVVSEGRGPAAITNCHFTDSAGSDTQVSVYFIAGQRDSVLMEGNETIATRSGNWVQGHTIYQATRGLVRNNRTSGARTGYYGDFFSTKGITVEGNQFLGCEHGVQLQLSPTGPGSESFSHEGYTIGQNRIESAGANVALDTLGPSTATRFIRDIRIHPSLSVLNVGAQVAPFTCDRIAA